MKLFFFIFLLLVACKEPYYKIEVLSNDKDTLYSVQRWTTPHTYVSDNHWYESIYETHDKDSAWTFYKVKIKEYEKEKL